MKVDDRPAALDPPLSAADERFALRPEDFRILASDSRVAILKALDERQMTGTELGKKLGLEKSTVAQHLDRLVEGGLVQRKEDDRLWVYYTLAPRGRRLLHPPRAGFSLLLAGSLLSAGASLTLFGTFVLGNLAREVASPLQAPSESPETTGSMDDTSGGSAPASPPAEGAAAGDGDAGAVADMAPASEPAVSIPLLPALAIGSFLLAAALGAGAWLLRPGRGPSKA